MATIQGVKQRFGIIGNTAALNRAIDVALQVAPTDISVLITGESGVGKEIMPQVIHGYSSRKHASYIAVNCGAIPEGTIDSELFGHEKGSFTGAHDSRKGYFEVADGGTIFLDEVAELPLQTQVRLLRVLETGEFIRVGSSKVQKTNVRIIAAANANMLEAIQKGKFREDLYYRLSTVPIHLPPLRERKDDIYLLFRKFAADFSEKYKTPSLRLTDEAIQLLVAYRWPGNIRQLKNVTEQIAVIEQEREITKETLLKYLPVDNGNLPALVPSSGGSSNDFSEREILYKVLFDMKKDMNELKKLVHGIIANNQEGNIQFTDDQTAILQKLNSEVQTPSVVSSNNTNVDLPYNISYTSENEPVEQHEEVEDTLNIADMEKDLIMKALKKYNRKRKYAAQELGISERTLYRKIKEYNINV